MPCIVVFTLLAVGAGVAYVFSRSSDCEAQLRSLFEVSEEPYGQPFERARSGAISSRNINVGPNAIGQAPAWRVWRAERALDSHHHHYYYRSGGVMWENLGGTFHNRPWVVSANAGHLEVHCSSANNSVWRRVWREDGGWGHGWEPYPPEYFSARHPYAVAHASGDVECFIVWWGYNLATQAQRNGEWGEWTDLRMRTAHVPLALPCINANRDGDGNTAEDIMIFALGADNALWTTARVGQVWGEWRSLGGAFTTWPAGVALEDGSLHVLVVDLLSQLNMNSFVGGVWSGWRRVRILSTCAAEAARVPGKLAFVAAVCSQAGTVQTAVFNAVVQKWTAWHDQGAARLSSPPAVAATPCGAVWLFARGAANQLLARRAEHRLLARYPWIRVGAVGDIASPPSALVLGCDVHVFAVGVDGALRHVTLFS